MDILTLLMHSAACTDTRKMGGKEEDKKVRYQRWPDKTIDNWVAAFNILAAVIMEKYPEQGGALMQYANTIQ